MNLQDIQDDAKAPAVYLGGVRTLVLHNVDDLGGHVVQGAAKGPHGVRRGEPAQAEVAYLHHGHRVVGLAEHVCELYKTRIIGLLLIPKINASISLKR